MSKKKLKADIVVIGGGSAGLSTAAGAAMLDLNVILFEKGEMGGDCLNYGCVPSKALLSAAKYAEAIREASKYGISAGEPVIDWAAVKAHVQKAIDTIAPIDSQERFEGLGVTVFREHARFKDANTIESDSAEVKAKRIILATGSTAFIPPIPGLSETPFVTNEEIFHLPELPKHLLILGGGPIGMEMAQAFRRFGSDVTVIEMQKAMGRSEPDHAAVAVGQLREEGVTILEGHKATMVSSIDGAITVDMETADGHESVTGTDLLVAVGRKAAISELNLEAGNVEHDGRHVTVGQTLRSKSNKKVWALGDVAGLGQFTHQAGWHASVFTRRALFKQRTKADSLPPPAVTYTSPEVAQLGLTEAEAREVHGNSVKTTSFPFHENDRAIAEGKTLGEAKLVIKGSKILGAHVVGEGAGDIIQLASVAMSNKLKLTALTNFISPYPTRAEVVKRAASAYYTPTVFGSSAKRLVSILKRF